jgi:hypothetical protein
VVGTIRVRAAIRLRAGEDIVLDWRRVTDAVDYLALLGPRGLLEKIAAALRLDERVAVKLAEVLRNDRVLRVAKLGQRSVVPGALANTVASIDGRLARPSLSTQVSVPSVTAGANRASERLAVRVGASQPAQVASLAHANAGNKEAHGMLHSRAATLLAAASRRLLGQRQIGTCQNQRNCGHN